MNTIKPLQKKKWYMHTNCAKILSPTPTYMGIMAGWQAGKQMKYRYKG